MNSEGFLLIKEQNRNKNPAGISFDYTEKDVYMQFIFSLFMAVSGENNGKKQKENI